MDRTKAEAKYYKFGLYLIIVILVILVGQNLSFRLDLTANGLYSLSKASKQAVSTLKEPLTINVFFSKNLPAPYNNIERYLHDILGEYSLYSQKYLSYRFFDVSAKEGDVSGKAEENRKKAQDYGIYPINVQTIEQDQAKVQRAYMGMVLIHGDIVENIPAITSTEGLEYKITSTIQKMNNKISALLNLPEKIKVELVQSSSLDAIAPEVGLEGLNGLAGQIADVIKEQNGKAYNQLEFMRIDPTQQNLPQEESMRFRRFKLQWPEIQKPDKAPISAGEGILALGMRFSGKSVERRLLTSSLSLTSQGFQEQFKIVDTAQIKEFIEENIDNLINIHEELGYLSTQGTLPLAASLPPQLQAVQPQTGSLTHLNTLLNKSYSVKQVNLSDEEIPDSIDTLIIAGPKEKFSDWELFQIDQFLMKGKSLALFLDSFNEIQPQGQQQMYGQQPVYLPINTGLEKLLENYGVSVKKAYVLDENCYVSRDQQMGEMPIYFAPLIKNENINHDLDFLKNIKELILIKASSVEIDSQKTKKDYLNAVPLISSSAASWEMAGRINLTPFMLSPPTNPDEKKSRPLAYLIEGEFPSYFADKPIPQKPESEPKGEGEGKNQDDKKQKQEQSGEGQKVPKQEPPVKGEKEMLTKGQSGKIFLIGTADILRDNVLDENGESPNAVFLLNIIDYLNGQEDIAVMRSKTQRFNPLKDTKAVTRTFVKVLNIAGLPILVILFGFYIWIRRKARRRVIQTMFSRMA